MKGSDDRCRWLDLGWFLACALAASAWCVSAGIRLSATFDEPLYISRGLEAWRTGSHQGLIQLGTMPLAIDLQTLPLYLAEQWRGRPFDASAELSRLLPWARLGTLVFWWVLLAYGWLAGRQLAGPWGGRLAVAWMACEPNLLAHAGLATTDIAVSACLLALTCHFRNGREDGWTRRIGVPACWYGAALLAKASALVFGPLCLLAVEFDRLWRAGALRRLQAGRWTAAEGVARRWVKAPHFWCAAFRPFRRDLTRIVALGLMLMLVYCGCDWQSEPSFVRWARQLPGDAPGRGAMLALAERLTIFRNGAEGLVRQVKHNLRGHQGTFLLGQAYPRSVWYYFPIALSIKLAVPLLAMPLVVPVLRRRSLVNWALLAALALLLFSVACRVQIGIRLVLPLVALLVVGLAAAIVETARSAPSTWRRGLVVGSAAVVAAWMAAGSVRVWPEGLCYTNELWGGWRQGYLCLSDSNYDWGQGLNELRAWQASHHVPRIDVWYFGTDPSVDAPPLHKLPLDALEIRQPADVAGLATCRYVAVGTTMLYGTTRRLPGHEPAAAFFRARRPIDRTATFLIYRLDDRSSDAPLALTATTPGSRRGSRK